MWGPCRLVRCRYCARAERHWVGGAGLTRCCRPSALPPQIRRYPDMFPIASCNSKLNSWNCPPNGIQIASACGSPCCCPSKVPARLHVCPLQPCGHTPASSPVALPTVAHSSVVNSTVVALRTGSLLANSGPTGASAVPVFSLQPCSWQSSLGLLLTGERCGMWLILRSRMSHTLPATMCQTRDASRTPLSVPGLHAVLGLHAARHARLHPLLSRQIPGCTRCIKPQGTTSCCPGTSTGEEERRPCQPTYHLPVQPCRGSVHHSTVGVCKSTPLLRISAAHLLHPPTTHLPTHPPTCLLQHDAHFHPDPGPGVWSSHHSGGSLHHFPGADPRVHQLLLGSHRCTDWWVECA